MTDADTTASDEPGLRCQKCAIGNGLVLMGWLVHDFSTEYRRNDLMEI